MAAAWKRNIHLADGRLPKALAFLYYSCGPMVRMADATCDIVKCESCDTPMLSYYTADRLIVYVCPSCVDWSASEAQNKSQLFFIN